MEYTKATSNLNFLLWPQVYLLGSLQKAGARFAAAKKIKIYPKFKGLWYRISNF
jgi:hypothetical protein